MDCHSTIRNFEMLKDFLDLNMIFFFWETQNENIF